MWTVCLLLYTVAAHLCSVQGICLTWNATKDNAFLECQVLGDFSIESQIQLMDSDDQIRVKCSIYDSPYCVAREEGDIVFGEASNNGFKLVFQTTTKNVQGIWKCFHGRESAIIHIDLSKGIMYSPEIHLSGEIKVHSKITLTCYSCTIPDTKSAYLFVNSVLEDVVRLHEGKCYRKRRQCSQTECSCSTEGNYFTWSFSSDLSYLEFACEMRFKDEETSLLSIHTATLYYNNTEFEPKIKTIRTIPVSDKDIYDGGTDNENSGIVVIITTVLLISIIAGITFGCTMRNKFTGQELHMKGQTDATELDVEVIGADRIKKNVDRIETEMNVGQIETENNVGQIETETNVCQIETEKNVGQIETEKNVGQIETEKNVGQIETEKNVGQIETEKNVGRIKTEKNVGQIETEKNVSQIETEKNVGQIKTEKNVGQIETEKITSRKRKKTLSFSQTLCDKCIEIPVCTVCINCRELYCKSCCDVHTESEKDHTILHIPHVAAENQEIKCGKCKNKTAEQLCTICLNLMCETCAESHEHEGNEGIRMMIIYHGHPKLLRQTSEEKLNFFQNFSIEKRGERYPIRICGISYIADGRLILVDKRNRNLLVFQSKEEKNRLHLEDEPHALTSMTGQHIALTFPFEMEIRIYKISENSIDKLNIIFLPSLNLHNFKPYSIAYDNDVFVVEVGEGDDGKIIIMNKTQIHCEIPNKNRAYFTGNTVRLALEVNNQNPLEGRVFLSALSKNVVFCVDFQGNEIWKVSIPSPRGISVVPENCIPRNNLVICSRRCNTIFGLNKENGGNKQILLSEGKIKLPRYITCNNKDRLLCIQVGTEDGKEESVSCVEVRAPPSN